jgi:hypothetical protein
MSPRTLVVHEKKKAVNHYILQKTLLVVCTKVRDLIIFIGEIIFIRISLKELQTPTMVLTFLQ